MVYFIHEIENMSPAKRARVLTSDAVLCKNARHRQLAKDWGCMFYAQYQGHMLASLTEEGIDKHIYH